MVAMFTGALHVAIFATPPSTVAIIDCLQAAHSHLDENIFFLTESVIGL